MITINRNAKLINFNFWSYAKQHCFTYDELNELENVFNEVYPDGIDEVDLNDMFWHKEEWLCELIRLDYDEYLNR